MAFGNPLLEEMTWPEVADAIDQKRPVVIAVGSTEQHGPHLPLNTDCVIPQAIAVEAAKQIPIVVAPPIRFGAMSRPLSGGGETFKGTLSLRGTTLIATLHEVTSALAKHGFERICIQNWHYENAGYLWEAADLTHSRYPNVRLLIVENPMPDFSEDELAKIFPHGFPGWDVEHASIMETSMMYVIRPELVRRDRIVDDEARRHPGWDVVPAPDDFIPKSGVLWHPTEASEVTGRLLMDAAVKKLVTAIRTELL